MWVCDCYAFKFTYYSFQNAPKFYSLFSALSLITPHYSSDLYCANDNKIHGHMSNILENILSCISRISSIKIVTYYSQNYAGILGTSLSMTVQLL